jgi:glycosyltransferase involved in cell wall biosynthesis
MVTAGGPNRVPRLIKSIAALERQTYTQRELVIVTDVMSDEDFAALEVHCRPRKQLPIRLIRTTTKKTLGALRNMTVEAARGEVVCQWDDDDLYHPYRLSLQHDALEVSPGAVFLQDVMHLLEEHRAMYWLRWDIPDLPCHPATLMARREIMPEYPEVGRDSRSSEDKNLFLQLTHARRVALINDHPYLYTYVLHGSNTFSLVHHMLLLQFAVSEREIRRHPHLLAELARIDLDRTDIRMMSPSGIVKGRGW